MAPVTPILEEQIAALTEAIDRHARDISARSGYRGFNRVRANREHEALKAALATLQGLRSAP
jgi:hypothetical protein